VETGSCYPIRNGKVMIREIDKGSEEELDGVVEVNRSNVKRWYKDPLNERGETSLDELNLCTIFLHGGWWIVKQTLKSYLDWMNNCKATMLIAKIIESSDKSEVGKIVGQKFQRSGVQIR